MGEDVGAQLTMPSSSKACKMFSCFDFSRCSVFSGFPVYFYDSEEDLNAGELAPFIKSMVEEYSKANIYRTYDPNTACIFVAVIGQQLNRIRSEALEKSLHKLPFWNGDGRNHVLINLYRDENHDIDAFGGINTGRAIIVQSPFVKTIFRPGFDIVIPPSIGKLSGDVWDELPPISPIRRKYFVSFSGSFYSVIKTENTQDSLNSIETSVISFLKKLSTVDSEINVEFSCNSVVIGAINGEYSLCQNDQTRHDLLTKSTFSLIISPINVTYVSTNLFQLRLYEALKYGAIPVILGDHVTLPYMEILDWTKAAVILPKARYTEFHFILRTFTDTAMATMRRIGRFYFETYFSTTQNILDSVLASIRYRLNIPPASVKDKESPSVFGNNSFISYKYDDVNPENDEVLGPLEGVLPSIKYRNNFTENVFYHTFTHAGDPFRNYPFTPFEHVLPSESKFIGK